MYRKLTVCSKNIWYRLTDSSGKVVIENQPMIAGGSAGVRDTRQSKHSDLWSQAALQGNDPSGKIPLYRITPFQEKAQRGVRYPDSRLCSAPALHTAFEKVLAWLP